MTLRTVARQTPLSMVFPRQEYWSEWPFPPPGDLPNPGIEPMSPVSPALADKFFTTEPPVYKPPTFDLYPIRKLSFLNSGFSQDRPGFTVVTNDFQILVI